ncbi:hypothetical protein [Salimicrobium album]|uniref:hypothetical protein n=1 Tax=Salimicrobium album TaxID=50717 RepID=UPI00116005A7|nr:hypothetical protein [Salimicrobium album]
MKEFMGVLMDVKVSMAELNGKVDKIISIEEKVNNTYDIAKGTERVAKDNKAILAKKADDDDLQRLQKDLKQKADKSDVERIVKEKDNWQKNLPAWAAVILSLVALLVPYLLT